MKEFFGRACFYIGAIIFAIGIMSPDSDNLLVPCGIVITGLIICRATIKFIDFDDEFDK